MIIGFKFKKKYQIVSQNNNLLFADAILYYSWVFNKCQSKAGSSSACLDNRDRAIHPSWQGYLRGKKSSTNSDLKICYGDVYVIQN